MVQLVSTAFRKAGRIFISLTLIIAASVGVMASRRMTIFEFSEARTSGEWMPINDTVMGGVSLSRFEITSEGTAVFTGDLSLENKGGFASVRSFPRNVDLRGFSGLTLHFRGDGNRYKINLKNDGSFDGVLYRAVFDTAPGEWKTVNLDLEEFIPTFRGRVVKDSAPLDPARIVSFGLMISDKQAGPFRLELSRIEAYAD